MLQIHVPHSGVISADWLAESLRLTLFKSVVGDVLPIWHRIVGHPPAEASERTAESFRSENGPYGAGALYVTQQGGRIDIVYADKPEGQVFAPRGRPSKDLVHVGPITAALDTMINLVGTLDEFFVEVSRVAFAPIVVRQAQDSASASQLIKEQTDLPIGHGDTDVSWQVNKPRIASSFNGTINRVVKWQAMTIQKVTLLASGLQQPVNYPNQLIYFARLEADVNTLASSSISFPNTKEVLHELIRETVNLLAAPF